MVFRSKTCPLNQSIDIHIGMFAPRQPLPRLLQALTHGVAFLHALTEALPMFFSFWSYELWVQVLGKWWNMMINWLGGILFDTNPCEIDQINTGLTMHTMIQTQWLWQEMKHKQQIATMSAMSEGYLKDIEQIFNMYWTTHFQRIFSAWRRETYPIRRSQCTIATALRQRIPSKRDRPHGGNSSSKSNSPRYLASFL